MIKNFVTLFFLGVSMSLTSSQSCFFPKNYENQYWNAFLLKAKKDHKAAENLIHAIQSGAVLDQPAWSKEKHDSIDDYFDALFVIFFHDNPQSITNMSIFHELGVPFVDEHLNCLNPEMIQAKVQEKIDFLQKLDEFNYVTLFDEQKMTYRICKWILQDKQGKMPFLWHRYFVNQMHSALQKMVNLFVSDHVLSSSQDVNLYILRLSKLPQQLDEIVQLLEHQKNKNIIPPKFALEKIIVLLNSLMPDVVSDSIFYDHLMKNASQLMVDQQATQAQLVDLLQNQIYPALNKLKTYCEQLVPHSHMHGVWALPDGDAYYAHTLKHHTTTELTPDQVHEIGLQEVDKLQQEVAAIVVSLGIETDDVVAALKDIMEQGNYAANQKEKCLHDIQQILQRCRESLHQLFDVKPDQSLNVCAVREDLQNGAPLAFYMHADFIGNRSAAYYINLKNTADISRYLLETLTVHEAEPGHHFQISIQNEMPSLIRKITGYNAFAEGWALYCEKLAYEEKFFSTPYHELGYLQFELVRAVRLVVDTGIHNKRWSYEQAMDYMLKNTGMPLDFVTTEIERYFVWPGQACSYKIGQLKILELREHAKQMLGELFDIRMFHNCILQNGALPLTLLEEVVQEYIDTTLAT